MWIGPKPKLGGKFPLSISLLKASLSVKEPICDQLANQTLGIDLVFFHTLNQALLSPFTHNQTVLCCVTDENQREQKVFVLNILYLSRWPAKLGASAVKIEI